MTQYPNAPVKAVERIFKTFRGQEEIGNTDSATAGASSRGRGADRSSGRIRGRGSAGRR